MTLFSKCLAEGMGECNPDNSFGGVFIFLNASEETTSVITVDPTELSPEASCHIRSLPVLLTELITKSISSGDKVIKSINSTEYFSNFLSFIASLAVFIIFE